MRICYFIFFERKGHNLNTKYLKNDKNEEIAAGLLYQCYKSRIFTY